MKKINLLSSSLILSVFLHSLIIFLFYVSIDAKKSPLIYNWFNIVSKKDLFFQKRDVILPPLGDFSSHNLRKNYLFLPFSRNISLLKDRNDYPLVFSSFSADKTIKEGGEITEKNNYFYLWERTSFVSPQREEVVTYKLFVSPYGKVIFSYPEKLPINSYDNLYLQEYIREATFFMRDKFFWTRIKSVVK